MSFPLRCTLAVCRSLWRLFFLALILSVIAITAVFALFIQLGDHRDTIAHWISVSFQQPLAIERITTYWDGWIPVLELTRVRLLDEDKSQVIAKFEHAKVRFDLVASILHKQVITEGIRISGSRFGLLHHAGGRVSLAGFSFADAVDGIQAADQESGLIDWLLQQPRISLESAQFQWFERQYAPLLFRGVNLLLHKQGRRHAIAGSLKFPLRKAALIPWTDIRIQGGELRFDTLSTWQQSRLQALNGEISIRDVHLSSARASLYLESVAGKLAVEQHAQGGWMIDVDGFSFRTGQQDWPASQIRLAVMPEAGGIRMEGQLGFLRLDGLAPLLSGLPVLPVKLRNTLALILPQAELHGTRFSLAPGEWRISTRVTHWHNKPWLNLPGLANWSGRLALGPDEGSLDLDTRNAHIHNARFFAEPHPLNNIYGTITWQRQGPAWSIRTKGLYFSNPDIEIAGLEGKISIPANDASVYSNLKLYFENARLAQAFRYVPDRKVGKRVIRWLKRGLTAGTVVRGEAVMQGPLASLPFDHNEGVLQLDAQVVDADIDYAPGWPKLTDIKGKVRIAGRALTVTASRGKTTSMRIYRTKVKIADLSARPPVLTVQGKAYGKAANGLRFIRNSPLRHTVNLGREVLDLGGNIRLRLDLALPLAGGEQAKALGTITFKGNTLHEKTLDLVLADLQGDLKFSGSVLFADELTANWQARPVKLSVKTLKEADSVQVRLRGSADRSFLKKLTADLSPEFGYGGLLDRVSGNTAWETTFDFPARSGTASAEAAPTKLKLHIESDLQGMVIDLPAPFAKSADEKRFLAIDTQLSQNADSVLPSFSDSKGGIERLQSTKPDLAIHLRYAEILKAVFRFSGGELSGGELFFGKRYFQNRGKIRADNAALQPGFTVLGRLPELSLDDWRRLLSEFSSPGSELPEFVPSIPRFELKFDRLETSGQTFHALNVLAYPRGTRWLIKLNGQEVAGTLEYDPAKPHLSMVLGWLDINVSDDENSSFPAQSLIPENWPALSFSCADLRINGIKLGKAHLQAHPIREGLRIDKLTITTVDTALTASGTWTKQFGKQHSRINASIDSDSLGHTLSRFGHGKAMIKGAATHIRIDAAWPGSPDKIDLAQIQGKLGIRIGKGQLLDVEPGAAGRAFGLFDLRAIPRRLSLDFSDVLEEGFSFSDIRGAFVIKDGYADTDNLTLKGSTADIAISGRTNLTARTYAQKMTVIPHVSNALPVAGVLAGGPAAGLAVLVVQKILQKKIEKAVSYQYTITGNWDDPIVKAINIPQMPASDAD
ncbi:MAG: TIGR02099 family protein [Gammaproteobacteria bacterium]|nr:TIGR02099 family protein [Gammaproteobacteria bacterium]